MKASGYGSNKIGLDFIKGTTDPANFHLCMVKERLVTKTPDSRIHLRRPLARTWRSRRRRKYCIVVGFDGTSLNPLIFYKQGGEF